MISNLFTELLGAIVVFGFGWIMSNLVIKRKKHALKMVLGIQNNSETDGVRVITPVYHKQLDDNLMHHKDGIAVSYILVLLHEISVGSQIIAYHQITRDSQDSPKDTFVIASPISNGKTEEYLKKYCPRFHVIDERPEDKNRQVPPTAGDARFSDGRLRFGFRIDSPSHLQSGEEEAYLEFPVYAENDYAVLIKINSKDSILNRTIHLLFGLGATGTAASAYFLNKYYKDIYDVVGDNSYCLLVKFDRKEGYKHVNRKFINLSEKVFDD